MQLVNIVEGGQRARMSKRKGEFITLDELIDDIGVDAARFFMVQRSHDTAARPRPRARALDRRRTTPSTTSSTRTRGSRASSARRSGREGPSSATRPRSPPTASRRRPSPPSGRSSGGCSSSPTRSRRRPSGGRRTGSAPTPRRPRPTSTPSTATAASSAPSPSSNGPARALHRRQADDRDDARPARGRGAGGDVGRGELPRDVDQQRGGTRARFVTFARLCALCRRDCAGRISSYDVSTRRFRIARARGRRATSRTTRTCLPY